MMSGVGVVQLVGAGPGDTGLITVKGLDALRRADVIVYDRLAPVELLTEAREDAKLISVGKSRGAAMLAQSEINGLLIAEAQDGMRVCRLKGGDPFVFGRGGEEAVALAEAGVPFEIVPGVSSAIAAASYAGIPVTHRGITSSFTVVTGSEDPDSPSFGSDWETMAKIDGTLVILMGVANISNIADSLIEHGRSPCEPSAAVYRGTSPRQRTVVGTLGDIGEKVRDADLKPPVVFVIGQVVELRDQIGWFDNLPLFGKRVLVTRARSQASRLANGLTELGADIVQCPVIRSEPLLDTSELDATLMELQRYQWIAFASPNAVNQLFQRIYALGTDARSLSSIRVAAVGPATVSALRSHGVVADLQPETYTADGLVEAFADLDVSQKSALVLKSDIGRETLPTGLRRLGAFVTEVAAYRTVAAEDSADIARGAFDAGIDAVTFTSSSTVKNLIGLLDGDIKAINDSVVVCMGPVTAGTAKMSGIQVDVIPDEQSIPAMITALCRFYERGG